MEEQVNSNEQFRKKKGTEKHEEHTQKCFHHYLQKQKYKGLKTIKSDRR